jgi:hypothetical protein
MPCITEMPSVTVAPVAPPRPTAELRRAAARLADALVEFDAALDEGAAMAVLVRLDQEVVAATRLHDAALAGARLEA